MSTEYKRMQQRYGNYTDFDGNRANLLPNEFASVTSDDPNTSSGKALYFNFGANSCERILTDATDINTDDIATDAIIDDKIAENQIHFSHLDLSMQTMLNDYGSRIDAKLDNATGSVKTANIDNEAVTYAKLSTELQADIDKIPSTPAFVEYKGSLSSSTALDSSAYCTMGGIYQFIADDYLADDIGLDTDTACELRFINSYQIITVTETQQVFARKVNRVAPIFNADVWAEVVNPRITALESANTILENAINGVS